MMPPRLVEDMLGFFLQVVRSLFDLLLLTYLTRPYALSQITAKGPPESI